MKARFFIFVPAFVEYCNFTLKNVLVFFGELLTDLRLLSLKYFNIGGCHCELGLLEIFILRSVFSGKNFKIYFRLILKSNTIDWREVSTF